jgi:hypothetical protein
VSWIHVAQSPLANCCKLVMYLRFPQNVGRGGGGHLDISATLCLPKKETAQWGESKYLHLITTSTTVQIH